MPVRVLALLAGVVLVSPVRAQPLLERHTLTGDWNGVRPALSAHGLDLYLTYTGTMWAKALIADDQGNPVLGAFARVAGSPQDARNVVAINADTPEWRCSGRSRRGRRTSWESRCRGASRMPRSSCVGSPEIPAEVEQLDVRREPELELPVVRIEDLLLPRVDVECDGVRRAPCRPS
jgi:hypothetical protein